MFLGLTCLDHLVNLISCHTCTEEAPNFKVSNIVRQLAWHTTFLMTQLSAAAFHISCPDSANGGGDIHRAGNSRCGNRSV